MFEMLTIFKFTKLFLIFKIEEKITHKGTCFVGD